LFAYTGADPIGADEYVARGFGPVLELYRDGAITKLRIPKKCLVELHDVLKSRE
jgi:hypothetical protein